MIKPSAADPAHKDALGASVQILPLPAGLYLFSVTAAPSLPRTSSALQLPALHVGLGPGVHSDLVEFITGPATDGAWLFAVTDLLIARVKGSGTTLMLTSVRAPRGEVLSIKIERLDSRSEAAAAAAATAPARIAAPTATPRLRISAHIRSRGDMSFTDEPWAGRVAPDLWVESFSIRPLAQFNASDLEYKGLTGSGFETPWLTDNAMCGTKGMSVPLVGFAVRLKPRPKTAGYDCEYSGYFKSGQTVGPLRNGAPCRSKVANDPLEGLQIRIVKRAASAKSLPEATPQRARAKRKSKPAPSKPVPKRAKALRRK